MVKQRRATKSRFLATELTKTKLSTVKEQFPHWRQREKKRDNLPAEMNLEVLKDFFDFLGYKDDAFVDIPEKYLNLKENEGTRWIYGYIKKHLFHSEEKPAANPKTSAKKKTPVVKTDTGKSDDSQIKET